MAAYEDIQPLIASRNGTGIVKSADKYSVLEDKIKQNVEENPTCLLPCFMDKILSMASDAEFAQQLDPETLTSIIQEAYNRNMKSLMELLCLTLVNKVQKKTSVEFNIAQECGHSSVAKCSDDRLRSRRRETFIKISDVVGLDYYPVLTHTSEMIKDLVRDVEKNLEFDDCVNKFMESSKCVVSDDVYRDIKKLDDATERLYIMVCKGHTLAIRLCSNVVERLVQIFNYRDIEYSQFLAASILMSARYHNCSKIINEQAIPVLVKLMNSPSAQIAKMVVITLTHFACESSDHIQVMVNNRALEVAQEVVKNSNSGGFYFVCKLAKFLAVVCRATNLSPDKEKVAVTILQNLFQNKLYTFSTIHITRACYALQYLSYEKPVAVTNEVLKSLVEYLSHDDKSVVASALGVVGNIVRWGPVVHIQYLTRDCRLLQCLGKSVLCSEFKKFRKEACQIISNVAVRSKTSIKDEAGLIESLWKLLEKDESDVKMEASWAIFNGIYAL